MDVGDRQAGGLGEEWVQRASGGGGERGVEHGAWRVARGSARLQCRVVSRWWAERTGC
jgi:hypothetical protein